jgi:cytochrome P450
MTSKKNSHDTPGRSPRGSVPQGDLYNPLDPRFVTDPHPFLHRLRREDPVHWNPVLNVWVLTAYADVFKALHDDRLSSDTRHWDHYKQFFFRGRDPSGPVTQTFSKWMLQVDPPEHTRLRALATKTFTPRAVGRMRPYIDEMTHRLLDKVAGAGEMDLVNELAYPLPIAVVASMLGVPEEDHEKMKAWTEGMLPSFAPSMSAEALDNSNQAVTAFRDYFCNLVKNRSQEPRDDLLSALIAVYEAGDRLSEDELLSTCILLMFAGHISTTQLISDTILWLANNPEQLEMLKLDPGLIEGAIEESLRYTSPTQMVYRVALEDMEIGGKSVKKNQLVILSLAAANRDPAQFSDPDRFDIIRENNRHIALGHGTHYCMGAALGRLEGEVAVGVIVNRLPNIRVDHDSITREPNIIFRSLKSMRITFDAHRR